KQLDENILLYSNFGLNKEKVNINDLNSDYNILDNKNIISATVTENL
ncbi:9288_t:CDS:1, partial [Racocetra persica]